MQKIKVILSYDGSRYDGFAIQKGEVNTVSKKLYEAFSCVGINGKFNASGRTDKGVHASYQVIDILIPKFWYGRLEFLKKELNKKLNSSIMINKIEPVLSEFHSRFSAKKRVYRYIVSFDKPKPFFSNYVTYINNLNEEAVKNSIKLFEGIHNFEYFKKSGGDSKTYIREIYKARYYRYKNYGIFYFEATGYLRSQIRLMVGFLLKISDGKLTQTELKEQLKLKKEHSRFLAPPSGLYLAKVKY